LKWQCMLPSLASSFGHGFETARPGTSEEIWAAWRKSLPQWLPERAPVVVIAPHPDDETFGAGGLISLCAHRGDRVIIICVTNGEAARPEMPGLAAIRQAELCAAAGQLAGGLAAVEQLGMPDGQVARLGAELFRHLDSRIPGNATLIAPFEQDGHTDHDAIGRVCIEFAAKRRLTLARYPIWAWHRLTPQALGRQTAAQVMLNKRSQAAKAAAIDCYRSQTEDRAGGAIVPPHVLAYFRRDYEVYFL
jgi:LmbE family N-acetylglucosaminyl deacetylase